MPGQPDDADGEEIDREYVSDADERRAGEAREEQRRASDRPDDERLEQPPLGVPGDDAEGQEDGEDDAEEQRREHREPDQKRPREGAGVDLDVLRRLNVREVGEDVVVREPEENEERDREHEHDREHPPPHRLAEPVPGDNHDVVHVVSPPTTSR